MQNDDMVATAFRRFKPRGREASVGSTLKPLTLLLSRTEQR
jgi:hypothetical protein